MSSEKGERKLPPSYMSESRGSFSWSSNNWADPTVNPPLKSSDLNSTTTILGPNNIYKSVRMRHESEASVRESTIRASKAAELEAMAIARERGISERHGVLDALAQTLEANARRLADEEANVTIARSEVDIKARDMSLQCKTLEEMDAEHRGASRWLRREAARIEAEEIKRRAALDSAAEATRASAQELAQRRPLEHKNEQLSQLEISLNALRQNIENREQKLNQAESDAHETSLQLEKETQRLAQANETLKIRTADIDARAHSVAAADQAASQRAEALSRRAEKLELAKNEIELSAAQAEARCIQVEERELKIKELEIKMSDLERIVQEKMCAAEAKMEKANAAQTKANEALARAEQNERLSEERLGAELAARRQAIESQAQANKVENEGLETLRLKLDQREMTTVKRESQLATEREALNTKEKELKERQRSIEEKFKELEANENSARFADLEAREARLYACEQEANALAAQSEARVAELQEREQKLAQDLEAARSAAAARQIADEARRQALAAQQPWLRSVGTHSRWEDISWITEVAQRAADEQAKGHEGVRSALRSALRSGVSLGDQIREVCADLQAAAVRRFLRLCIIQSSPGISDEVLQYSMDALRSLAAQELVRRRALVAAIYCAHYSDVNSIKALHRVRTVSDAHRTSHIFRLCHNRFECLRLRPPAARSRFAAATAHWVAPQFRRMLFSLAAKFNGLRSTSINQDDDLTLAAVSQSCLGVFFGRDARHDHMDIEQIQKATRVELRFDDDGDDGRHAPRAACVFDSAQDLADFFELLDKDKRLTCLGVANGFISGSPEFDDEDDDDSQESPPHEVAIALDLFHQGVLCDVRLRLRALERPQRHLGSLRFLAEVDSHEEILLPLWRDIAHKDGWANDIAPNHIESTPTSHKQPPPAPHPYPGTNLSSKHLTTRTSYSTSSNANSSKLAFRHTTGSEWPAPPNFVRR